MIHFKDIVPGASATSATKTGLQYPRNIRATKRYYLLIKNKDQETYTHRYTDIHTWFCPPIFMYMMYMYVHLWLWECMHKGQWLTLVIDANHSSTLFNEAGFLKSYLAWGSSLCLLRLKLEAGYHGHWVFMWVLVIQEISVITPALK